MGKLAPKIDRRTAEDIAAQVQQLLEQYTGENKPIQGTRAALVNIFARFSEIIIERLNQVPDKNFLAFLDLLGASRLPPQPARVPLTFSLAAGTKVDAVVPKRTQVAAPPGEREKDPVIFETERELVVSAAKLESIFVRDPQQELYSDLSSIITTPVSLGVPIFRGNQPIEHILYIGHSELLGFPNIKNLWLQFNFSKKPGTVMELAWETLQETVNGVDWKEIIPERRGKRTARFGEINPITLSTVNSITNRWLRCRLLTPITIANEAPTGMVSVNQLPELKDIKIKATIGSSNLLIETGFANELPVDFTKYFFPFGEKPKLGDTLYFANNQAFSQQNAEITIQINLTNPASENNENEEEFAKPTKASRNLELKWEFWNGKIWQELGTAKLTNENEADIEDTTQAFTQNGHVKFNLFEKPYPTTVNGIKDFWIRVRIISGNYGREARYDKIPATQPAEYQFIEATFAPPLIGSITVDYTLTKQEKPETILTYNDTVYSDNLIQHIDNQNQLFPKPLILFQKTETDKPACYFGFSLPPGRTDFPNRTISLFNSIADLKYGEKLVPLSPKKSRIVGTANSTVTHKFWLTNNTSESVQFELTILGMYWNTNVPELLEVEANSEKELEVSVEIPDEAELDSSDRGFLQVSQVNNSSIIYNATFETFVGNKLPKNEQIKLSWQYWNGKEWGKLTVRDETENFTRPGLIEFLPPANFTLRKDFDLPSRYWLRVQWLSGDYEVEPRLKRVLLNTTMAVQTLTIQKEILGSSDGNENQKFQTTKQPILAGQQLEVREPEIPSVQEQQKIVFEEGEDAITSISDPTGRPKEIWVRWHQVKDFYQSGTRDRHYVLDNLTGKITFGDGRNGLIPPPGRGNIRMNRYQTGGGTAGNKPSGSIVQLKTTVPYVDKVINHQASAGGAEAETLNSLIERAPREIRHRQRAVTLEDYEDLAKLASPEVIRAKCIPLTNLKVNPLDTGGLLGAVSVIIVPRSTEAKPLPSLELINRVQDYLETYASPTVNISVVGPLYVRVSITVEIALISLEGGSQVAQAVEQKLASFLHPLTGGFEGMGWDFGREPYKSDFYRLLEGIAGVDHVRNLEVDEIEELTGAKQTGRFLVYSGKHEISLTFVG